MGLILPNETWSQIFSSLGLSSKKSASLTCKRWFEIIRRDRGLSSHLCLTLSAKELLNSIKNSDWLWNNWPSLKTLKLSGKQFGPKADPSLKEINFKKQCPSLEKVILPAYCDLEVFWPELGHGLGRVEEISFNPQNEENLTLFNMKHVTVLKIARVSGKDLWDDATFCDAMKFVGKYAENLYWLQISIHENHDWSRDVLENGFFPMIQNISHQLTKVTLDLEGIDDHLKCAIYKTLSDQCPNLDLFELKDDFIHSIPVVNGFAQLKKLNCTSVLPMYLAEFVSTSNNITQLSLNQLWAQSLMFSAHAISQKYQKLQDFQMTLGMTIEEKRIVLQLASRWAKDIDQHFQQRTKVKLEIGIVPKWDQDNRKYDRITISKIPFQKTSVQTIQNQDPWPPEFLSSSDHLDNIGY